MTRKQNEQLQGLRKVFEHVAAWQFLCFILLIAFVWAAEVVDLKHVLFGTKRQTEVDWLHACMLTAAVIAVGIITVGQTYMQGKRILRGYIIVCSYCHKVQIENRAWQQMEIYVSRHSEAEFSHGVCPGCFQRLSAELDREEPKGSGET